MGSARPGLRFRATVARSGCRLEDHLAQLNTSLYVTHVSPHSIDTERAIKQI